ncbi:hypothetical protein DFH07DRAFT_951301 [Mycena maculata]|uniref:Uncharacterized protein n=1 Tax=Mycena maculata TaxID=230809 RepID=A0AAD7K3W7_9AGAR|nr:hypothetical protein DFH07DRAFT_951301 [Mycena maculata]
MSQDVPQALAAVYQAVYSPLDASDVPHINEVADDMEAEGETLSDDAEPNEDTDPADTFDVAQLQEHLLEASKGVTNETEKEYRRLMGRCLEFLKQKGLIKQSEKLFTSKPDKLVPLWICSWIMHE